MEQMLSNRDRGTPRIKLPEKTKELKKKKPIEIDGTHNDIVIATEKFREDAPRAGIECTYFDYSYYEGIPTIIKLDKSLKTLLILTKDIAT